MDERRRQLERAAVTGDPEARAALLRERIRMGTLTAERVRLAAFLGDEGARMIVSPHEVSGPVASSWATWSISHFPSFVAAAERLAAGIRTGRRVPCPKYRYPSTPAGAAKAPRPCVCPDCHGTGTVLATEACPPPCPDLYGCTQCHGTGRVPESLRVPFLVRAAAACARLVWRLQVVALPRGEWAKVKRAIRAADAWAMDPSEANLRAWDDVFTWIWGPPSLVHEGPPVARDLGPRGDYATVIRNAARATSEAACREAICGLAEWVLNG